MCRHSAALVCVCVALSNFLAFQSFPWVCMWVATTTSAIHGAHRHVQQRQRALGPRECASGTNEAAPQLQCGPCENKATNLLPASAATAHARQRNDSLVDTCITGAVPRRNAAAQWQRNLSYHHSCELVRVGGGFDGCSPPVVHRAQPRVGPPRAKRACVGSAAAAALPPRTDTTRAVGRAARVH